VQKLLKDIDMLKIIGKKSEIYISFIFVQCINTILQAVRYKQEKAGVDFINMTT
jgi:hypothetical protein